MSRFLALLGDTNAIAAEVRNGMAIVGNSVIDASACADGPADVFLRPNDLSWSVNDPAGIPATVTRVIDRPGSRRLLVAIGAGDMVELDVAPEVDISPSQRGYLTTLRARTFVRNERNRNEL